MSTPMRWGPPPRGGRGGGGSYHVLGVYIPRPVAWLILIVLAMSAGGSLLDRMGIPLVRSSWLSVDQVWQGEVWRVVTWAPLDLSPLGLLFGCLLLYFVGPDLLRRWGTRRFLLSFFGGGALVGAITCLIGRYVWRDVAGVPHLGLWPILEGLMIAWAVLFPDRQILVYFALPVAGRNLIVLTVAITVVMAALNGFPLFVPHFTAELAALVYMDVLSVRPWIARGRLALFQRRYRRRTAKLTRIDRDDDPPRWTH
jgi:membrane associated rhomboid family serine protease